MKLREKPDNDALLITWLSGAGFLLRSRNASVGIDLYLSNSCERADGSLKRLTPPGADPDELDLDCLAVSHDHGDHLDAGSIHRLIKPDNETFLLCPGSVTRAALGLGVDKSRIRELNRGQSFTFGDTAIRAVFCDHGPSAPDAVGFFISMAGRVVFFLGDSRFRTDFLDHISPYWPIDAFLVPINGRFGNPDARDAAYFTQMLKPKMAIPCHFWLTKEHGGDPGEFARLCGEIAPEAEARSLAIGETIIV